jgi:SRSO17 transposase
MINKLFDSKLLEAKYVGVDSSFGRDHKFLESLPKELVYFADIPCNHLVFLEEPRMEVPEYSGRGKKPFIPRPSIDPVSVASIANNNENPWQTAVLGTGSKGPIVARDKCIKVFNSHKGLPTQQVWLYIREMEDGSIKYALCNESLDVSIDAIRKPALMRWSIEQCFKECKTYIGMDQSETRSWIGWRREILLSLIASQFYLKLKLELTTKKRLSP